MAEPRILVEGGPVERRLKWAIAGVVGLAVGVLPVLGWTAVEALEAGMAVERASIANCRQIELVKGSVRQIIEEAQRLSTSSRVRTAREKEISVLFYRDALGRLQARRC